MKEKKHSNTLPTERQESTSQAYMLGDKKICQTYGDSTLPFNGIVYRHYVNKEGAEHYGWSYVGETPDEKTRLQSWNKPNCNNYAGKKLCEAREKYPLSDWGYEVLEIVYASTKEELEKFLHERETYYIRVFDSYEHGFNSNLGGTGNKGVKFDETRRKQNGDNRRGKPQSEETKARLRESSTGRKKTDEERMKISKGNRGKKRTPKQKAAQSARMKGKNPVQATAAAKEWHRNNPGGWWSNHPITPEIRANMKSAQQAKGTRVKAISENGSTVICFPTMLYAANHFPDMKVGSIAYFIKSGNVSKKAHCKFERITDAEYQAWKKQQEQNSPEN